MYIKIPGEPHAQGRARHGAYVSGGVARSRVYDPKESRDWKSYAAWTMAQQIGSGLPLHPSGPVDLRILAVFQCPKSDFKKKEPRARRCHTKKPDADNVLKAVKDAAKGVLWLDDSQVCHVQIEKVIGAQGEAPYIMLWVTERPWPNEDECP